ncbi:hypothetical protein [Luteolibacter pohnpeiensis]|nr:hypothetical protein [Luteolibacter pohnpeiensis]
MSQARHFFILSMLIPLSLTSCGSIKETTSAQVSKISNFSISGLLPGHIPVVEAREKDLVDLPSGKERALAYEQEKAQREMLLAGPINIKEPALPEGDDFVIGGLLPSKPE